MDRSPATLVETAPQLISGIYNYCHQWCERCPFTERCLTFRDIRQYEARNSDRSVVEHAHDSFEQTLALIEGWCAKQGIDFEELRQGANSEESSLEFANADAAIDRDPLYQLARTYTRVAFTLVQSLERAAPFQAWSASVHNAIETIGWYAGTVSAKLHRALQGSNDGVDEGIEWDAVQNDWNGSAKVARLAITESRREWSLLFDAGRTPPDSPVRKTIELLDRIDAELAQRFPRAMEFIRPGFDEAEVGAGGLTSLACFEHRR